MKSLRSIFYPARFFTQKQDKQIIEAIKEAEMDTSGEIRVHFQKKLKGNVFDAAVDTFYKLKMDETKEKNGVLFFFVPSKRQFAIIGDEGINSMVPENFWDEIKSILESGFKSGKKVESICEAIKMAGEKLKHFFPYKKIYDINELPDEISFS
ncbi:MAG: TPM domain-containing protein [Deltaproteobacteria bacterium]